MKIYVGSLIAITTGVEIDRKVPPRHPTNRLARFVLIDSIKRIEKISFYLDWKVSVPTLVTVTLPQKNSRQKNLPIDASVLRINAMQHLTLAASTARL